MAEPTTQAGTAAPFPEPPGEPLASVPSLAGEQGVVPKGYWDLVWVQFKQNRVATACLWIIVLLLILAAWAPVLANGKPFIWTKDGKTTYPLLQYLVAPSELFSVDYIFNYLLFATLTVPLAWFGFSLAHRFFPLPRKGRGGTWRRVGLPVLIGLTLAALPFLSPTTGLRQWRLDATDYPAAAAQLDRAKGEYALFPPVGQDPITPTRDYLKAPDSKNLLGTDKDGRDVLARMLHGSRISLSVGFISETLVVLLGILLGALAGYYKGWVDILISRFIEIMICFPTFFLILTIVAFIEPEKRSIFHIMLVIGVTGWPGVARLVRGEFLKLADQDFVTSARALGVSHARLMFRHMLPNALGPVLVTVAFGVAGAILTESSLSYLGFGAPPPTPTWGEMISQGKEHLEEAWWLIVFPGLSIFLTVTIYNLAGDGLRDAMDPKMRK